MPGPPRPLAHSHAPGQSDPVLGLDTPPGLPAVPAFDHGWRRPDGGRDPYLSYTEDEPAVNWSAELEELHVENSRDHFIDVWTRRAMLERIGPPTSGEVVVDLGCSTGYLLEELGSSRPEAHLIGVDMIESGLRTAHASVPEARLLQADVCALPLADASIDIAVSSNLLEHVADDRAALAELRRVLRPGARAVLVVPAGPGVYDYYDRFLGHERRYGRGELAAKARAAGMEVLEDAYLGSLLYPPFWLVKKYNRLRHWQIEGKALESRVESNIVVTRDSRVGRITCELERRLLAHGIKIPFGTRSMTVLRRPALEL